MTVQAEKRGALLVIVADGQEAGTVEEPGRTGPMYRATVGGQTTKHGTLGAAIQAVLERYRNASQRVDNGIPSK